MFICWILGVICTKQQHLWCLCSESSALTFLLAPSGSYLMHQLSTFRLVPCRVLSCESKCNIWRGDGEKRWVNAYCQNFSCGLLIKWCPPPPQQVQRMGSSSSLQLCRWVECIFRWYLFHSCNYQIIIIWWWRSLDAAKFSSAAAQKCPLVSFLLRETFSSFCGLQRKHRLRVQLN